MKLREAIQSVTKKLSEHRCMGADAVREALELTAFVAKKNRAQLMDDETLTDEQFNRLNELVDRRLNHEPLPQLLGTAIFLGREFKVSPDVLIPRPATEIIVSRLIDDWREKNVTIIDVGTGSGCAAISFALELPHANVIATDISLQALLTAKKNIDANGSPNNLKLLHANLAPPELLSYSTSELILFANLPYIPTKDIEQLDSDVRDFEPVTALDGGPDGLDLFRELFKQLSGKISTPLHFYLEAFPNQLAELEEIANENFNIKSTKIVSADSAGNSPIGLIIRIK